MLPDLLSANPAIVDMTFTSEDTKLLVDAADESNVPTSKLARASENEQEDDKWHGDEDGQHALEILGAGELESRGSEVKSRETMLMCWCIRHRCMALVRTLVSLGANVNMREPATGYTPLMLVCPHMSVPACLSERVVSKFQLHARNLLKCTVS